MNHYIYILESKNNRRYYIGVTNDIIRRLNEHNSGYNKSTKTFIPWKLIYFEKFNNAKYAYKREKYLKSLKNRKYIDKIIRSQLSG